MTDKQKTQKVREIQITQILIVSITISYIFCALGTCVEKSRHPTRVRLVLGIFVFSRDTLKIVKACQQQQGNVKSTHVLINNLNQTI